MKKTLWRVGTSYLGLMCMSVMASVVFTGLLVVAPVYRLFGAAWTNSVK